MKQRLDRWLSTLGYCSRSQAREWLREHCVTVMGSRVYDGRVHCFAEQVGVEEEPLDNPGPLSIALHKPLGVVCSHDPREGTSVYDLLPKRWQGRIPALQSVGRLDKETSGLLLLTDQGTLLHRLSHPHKKIFKGYRVTLTRPLTTSQREQLIEGVWLKGEEKACLPAKVKELAGGDVEIAICEGRYHQVRRMIAAVGAELLALHREWIGEIVLGELMAGQWRLETNLEQQFYHLS